MLTKDEIQSLLHSTEAYRVERTVSTGNMDKFCEAICAFANGANVLHLKPQVLKNIKVLLPPKQLIAKYVTIVKPMFDTINKLNTGNDSPSRQRDLLLPRLMSGKLEVKA